MNTKKVNYKELSNDEKKRLSGLAIAIGFGGVTATGVSVSL